MKIPQALRRNGGGYLESERVGALSELGSWMGSIFLSPLMI